MLYRFSTYSTYLSAHASLVTLVEKHAIPRAYSYIYIYIYMCLTHKPRYIHTLPSATHSFTLYTNWHAARATCIRLDLNMVYNRPIISFLKQQQKWPFVTSCFYMFVLEFYVFARVRVIFFFSSYVFLILFIIFIMFAE